MQVLEQALADEMFHIGPPQTVLRGMSDLFVISAAESRIYDLRVLGEVDGAALRDDLANLLQTTYLHAQMHHTTQQHTSTNSSFGGCMNCGM